MRTLTQRVEGLTEYLASGSFGVFILMTSVVWTLAMAIMMFWPQTFTPASAFAANFRIWCFGYDPLTGNFDSAKVIMVIVDPLFMGALVGLTWKSAIVRTFQEKKREVVWITATSTLIVGSIMGAIAAGQIALAKEEAGVVRDFTLVRGFEPANRLELTDQRGKIYKISPQKVTVVTAFYSRCQHTCPMLMRQAKKAFEKAGLDPSRVDIAVITLDPKNDTVETLKTTADRMKLAENWHLLTGDQGSVDKVLDAYKVARASDNNGNIGHSNLFYVIDKSGKIAFTIGLGSAQEVWLKQALELLSKEKT